MSKDLEIKYGLDDVVKELITSGRPGQEGIREALNLRMKQYSELELSQDNIKDLVRSFRDIETGSATSLVAICSFKRCLYRTRCPLYIDNKAPEGMECLHENKVLMDAMNRYLVSLNIDPDNYPEMVIVNQLVEYEVMEHRCNVILSYDQVDLVSTSMSFDKKTGMPITQEQISNALQIKLQIGNNKLKLLQEFIATRKEDVKKRALLKISSSDPYGAKRITDMKNKIKELANDTVEPDEVSSVFEGDIDNEQEIY